jgi:hypothetical protein
MESVCSSEKVVSIKSPHGVATHFIFFTIKLMLVSVMQYVLGKQTIGTSLNFVAN